MTFEQWVAVGGVASAILFGGGGIVALVTALSNRKVGVKTTENEANKTINITWEAIVDDLQTQIKDGREEFKQQLTNLNTKVDRLQTSLEERDQMLHAKDRLLLIAIGHIGKLELLIPPNPVPDRPEGLN
jgi:pyruvate/2-oxoglutarate dehydrogenase complex dihydrolipoamide dehydrogenase (E3) component